MRILVTGSSGTIGTRLSETLLGKGHDVVGVDWRPNKWQPSLDDRTIQQDLRDEKGLSKLPTDVDAVIHLAANARVYDLVKEPDRARDNFLTTFNVLEFARTKSVPRFIFASSREVYGNTDEEVLSEHMVKVEKCESPYTASKLGGEALVHSYSQCYALQGIILRFSNVYGAYDDSDRVVPLFIRLARAGKPLTIFGEGKCLDFTYIDDTVQGICLALEKFDRVHGETFNIAYGEGTTLTRLAEEVKLLTGSASEIKTAPPRAGEVVRYVANIEKAKKALGYAPKTSFEEGIKKAVEWYGENSY